VRHVSVEAVSQHVDGEKQIDFLLLSPPGCQGSDLEINSAERANAGVICC
jgi:hypothetical protein